MSLNNVAYEMAKKGDRLNEAEKLSKQSLDITAQNINNPVTVSYSSPSQVKAGNQYNYDLYADTYAFILFKENKFKEALTYEQPVVDHIKVIDPDIYENYIAILDANGQYKDAEQAAENAVKAGKSTPGIQQELKKDYVKVKGSDSGYEEYLASLGLAAKNKAKADLAKTMISQPAPSFTLKDANGTMVSLKDLKGKIVIVDFWATWCGPCKASFPGMQLAVNKYKDDPNIKFLFIDTWENGDNYVAGVKKFIADNNYTFHVLIDEKTAEGKQGKVVGTFGVTGIPTKFVIDKNGNIRFKYVGYSGSPEGIVDELTAMVDMATEAGSAVAAK